MRTRVKICGITRRQDALAAVEHGADAIGFVFYAPSGRCVDAAVAADIARHLPPFITKVGLFVNASADEVCAMQSQVNLDLLQFHGNEEPEFCNSFNQPYLKAIHMKAGSDLNQLVKKYSSASGLLLDSFNSDQPGGTGQVFDWSVVPTGLPRPVVLAGGLTPENVAAAIEQVKPYAVDVSSGVEQDKGIKDAAKIAAFMQAVRNCQ